MPKGRTHKYAVWRACERMRVRPPDVKDSWDDMDRDTKARVLGYHQVRSIEEAEIEAVKMSAGMR